MSNSFPIPDPSRPEAMMEHDQLMTWINDPLIQAALRREAFRTSFYAFVQYFWDTIIAEEPVWNWHIEYLCKELQEVAERVFLKFHGNYDEHGREIIERLSKLWDYFIINIPPGSSKSTIVSEMFPLWCWTIDPTLRFICGSFASTPAEDIAEKCYNIYRSEKFKKLYPKLVERSTGGKTNFKNGLKGERYTTSTGSAITGIHAHMKIIDDPMNPQIAASKLERERANKWLSETLGSRNVSAKITVTIIVMQRLHENDSTGYILTKAKDSGLRVKHICIPAEASKDIKPAELSKYYVNGLFDPVRRPKEQLILDKIEYGSYGYAGQMQQRPSPEEGGILKKAWFGLVKRERTPANYITHFQFDTAYTKETENDPTGVLAYYIEHGNIFITHAMSVYKEFPDLCRWLKEYTEARGYGPGSRIHVEPKASGKSLVQTIREGARLSIFESLPPKDDKITGVHIISPKVEAGRVYLHEGSWNEEFLDQVATFPNAEHDEYVDCLVAIIRREILKESSNNKNIIKNL